MGGWGNRLLTYLFNTFSQVVKIDCVEHRDLCAEQVIRAFPTLRLYRSGKAIAPDYREDR